MNTEYVYRSYKARSNGSLSNSNLNSRPYKTIEELLNDSRLKEPDQYIHNFITDQWYQVVNGWLTSVDKPNRQ